MLDYNVKIGLVAMRRNTTDRPRGTFLTWYSAEQRGKKFVNYIEENFKTENVSNNYPYLNYVQPLTILNQIVLYNPYYIITFVYVLVFLLI